MAAADRRRAARAAPDGGARHAAAPADLRPRQGRRAGQRRSRWCAASSAWLAARRHPRPRAQPASSSRSRSRRSSATAATSACACATRGSNRCSGRQAARGTRCRCVTDGRGRRLPDRQRRHVDATSTSGRSLARHRESGALVTMALIPNPRPSQYGGVVRLGRRVWSRGSRSPAAPGRPTRPSFHFIGVQVARARAFAALADGVPAESVNALYPPSDGRASAQRRRVRFGRVASSTSAHRATISTRRSRSPRAKAPGWSGRARRSDASAVLVRSRAVG